MNEFKIVYIFILAVIGWFGYAIERERRIKAENKIKKFYGIKCTEKKRFLPNINAADAKEILEKRVKTVVFATGSILAALAIKVVTWLSLLRRNMMEQLSINTEE